MGGRCAVLAAVLVWAGVLVGASASNASVALVCGLAVLPFVWLGVRAPPRIGTVLLLSALVLAAAARGNACRSVLDQPVGEGDQASGGWLVARVVSHPWREGGEPLAVVSLDSTSIAPSGTRVRLRLPAGCDAEWGDRIEALAILETPPALRNPGGYDARAAARADGITKTGTALVVRTLELRPSWQRATVAHWRRAIERALDRHLSAATRELTIPLVLGDRSGMSPELGWDLRASGLTHLLALSGLHVAWLAAAARMLAGLFGLGPRGRACAGAGSALLYIGLAGPLPSLVRAAVNEGLTAAGRGLSRALDPIQALATGTLALLCLAPMWATDVGFQLSCAASLGLVTIGPSLERALARVRLAHVLFRGTIPTIAAQALALPLLLGRFHAIAWSGLFANLAAVPVCGLLLAAAWLGAGLEASLPGAGAPWFAACEALSSTLRAIAAFAARAPSVLVPAGPDPALAWLAAFGAAALAYGVTAPRTLDAAAWPPARARVACTWLGVFGLTLALGLTLLVSPLRPPNGRLWLVALDVGQGDAVALGTRQGWWLVDAGPRTPHFDAGQSVVAPFFLWAGVRRLEGIVLTHDHLDHTGGAAAVLRAMAVARRFAPAPLPTVVGPSRRFAATPCVRGDTLSRDPPILVRWPPSGARLHGDNAASLVLEVGEGNVRALLAADVDSTVEESLAVAVRCALLKVAHHGAGSSSGTRFLAGLGARLALVSCGRRNRFGHPDAGALERLRATGIDVHRTDREGASWIELSESGARPIEWRRGPPRSIEHQAAADHRPAR